MLGSRLKQFVKLLLSVALAASLVSGCGIQQVSSAYPLESVTQNGSQASYVYRAENKTVPQVAKELAADRTPQQISKEDTERMFLVYPDVWFHLQKDPQKPADTLIEVSNQEYVRNNYGSDFLKGYILASILNDLFDGKRYYPGNYRGYTSRDIYKPSTEYRPPTVQERKNPPPITKDGVGSIIRRGDKADSPGSVGSGGDLTKKEPAVPPATGGSGKVIKSPESGSGSYTNNPQPKSGSSFTPPKNNSPPKTKVGGSGKVTKRR